MENHVQVLRALLWRSQAFWCSGVWSFVFRCVVLMFQRKIMVVCWTLEPLEVTQTIKTSETTYSVMQHHTPADCDIRTQLSRSWIYSWASL